LPVENFLAPGENVRYRSPTPVEYSGDYYDFYITDRRLMWHKRTGLIFKKDKFSTEVLENVTGIKYSEKGIISKKGIIQINMEDRKLEFSGSLSTIRAVYSHMQALMKYGEKKADTSIHVTVAPTVEEKGTEEDHSKLKLRLPKGEITKQRQASKRAKEDPLKILKLRLAKGEITKKKFSELKKALE
jgi:hypothetical protein